MVISVCLLPDLGEMKRHWKIYLFTAFRLRLVHNKGEDVLGSKIISVWKGLFVIFYILSLRYMSPREV